MSKLKSTRSWSIGVFVLALLLLLGVAYTIAGSRNDILGYRDAFGLLGQIAAAAAILSIVGLIVWVLAARSRSGGTGYAAVGTLILAGMFTCMYVYQAAPPPGPLMNDISTDLDDPPQFLAVIPLRPAGSSSIEYGGAEAAANQRRAHPEVAPVLSTLAPPAAFDRSVEIAEELGWAIVAQDRTTGIIEAIDTTTFFRFKDDVVIRVRPQGTGSRIDLRSHSRVGRSDLGKNAARIMQFVRAFPLRG
jgi:uncharacterized protein (DUF1499 family)